MQTASKAGEQDHRDTSLRARRAHPTTTAPDYTPLRVMRRNRAIRAASVGLIGVVLVLALFNVLGPRYQTTTRTVGGTSVTLEYPEIMRPGLASRWILSVHRPGGFDGKITVATTARWFEGFDFNDLLPNAASETERGDMVVYAFDPPPGDTFRLEIDFMATPTETLVRHATTTVAGDGLAPVSIPYRTIFLP